MATNSMDPTLPKGRHVLANKFTRFFRQPQRGEIVMFKTPQMREKGLVKRVVAIAGDTLAIRDKRVYINNMLLDEPYVQHTRPNERLIGDNIKPIGIPDGHVFVMGDNRDESQDSRDWKNPNGEWSPYVPVSMITGYISK